MKNIILQDCMLLKFMYLDYLWEVGTQGLFFISVFLYFNDYMYII